MNTPPGPISPIVSSKTNLSQPERGAIRAEAGTRANRANAAPKIKESKMTTTTEKFEVRNRWSGDVQFTAAIEVTPDMAPRIKLG